MPTKWTADQTDLKSDCAMRKQITVTVIVSVTRLFFFFFPVESQRGANLPWPAGMGSHPEQCLTTYLWGRRVFGAECLLERGSSWSLFLGDAEVRHCGAVWAGLHFGTEVASSPDAPMALLQGLGFPYSHSTAQQVPRHSYLALFLFLLPLGLTEQQQQQQKSRSVSCFH